MGFSTEEYLAFEKVTIAWKFGSDRIGARILIVYKWPEVWFLPKGPREFRLGRKSAHILIATNSPKFWLWPNKSLHLNSLFYEDATPRVGAVLAFKSVDFSP